MTTGHEEEFRRLFETEAVQRLSALAEHALELERHGDDPELVASMFRHAHTLKGGAGVVGFGALAEILHDLETLIEELRSGRRRADATAAEAILATVDALRDMVARAMTGEDQAGAASLARAALARAGDGGGAAPATAIVPAPAAPVERASRRSADAGSIPVPVERLDELVRLVGEGAAAQLRVGRLLSERLGDEPIALDEYRDLARVLQELQEKAMRARMVSVATVAGPLRRAVHDLSRGQGKHVRFEVLGQDTELDRHVLERLREPLVALVRNALDHGIEPPAERVAAGKEPEGAIRLHAMQIGGDVIISVADDGRGIDEARVRAVAGPGLDDPLSAIFDPGVTTADGLSGVSGRGVGLDAVRTAVESLRGRVDVRSMPGEGSEFRISVPMTLALRRCLLVRAGECAYALPMSSTVGLLPARAVRGLSAEGRPAVWFAGEAIPLADLGAVLGTSAPAAAGPVAVVSTAAGRHAFRVDAVSGQRDVLVKDLGPLVPRLDLVAGASVEPDGSVLLVLDPAGLLQAPAGVLAAPDAGMLAAAPQALRARILVVDDALTIRELQRSILERAGYAVITAASGAEALERLADGDVDLVLTDIEMPGMDGFALTEAIRADESRAGLPVLVLTSRDDEAGRRRGLEAGADGYLVKSAFDEHRLVTAVARLLGDPAPGDAGGAV
jgi:two-component system chemotaxis sensor kinase CheA